MKNEDYDCVAAKHRAAARIAQRLKGLTIEEELRYWHACYQRMQPRGATRVAEPRAPYQPS
jgi:hypothetical protein